MHLIHAEDFSLSTKSNFMHIAPWSNGASAFSVPILTFHNISKQKGKLCSLVDEVPVVL